MDQQPSGPEIVEVWDRVLQQTKLAQENRTEPVVWACQVRSTLNSAGLTLPSVELAHLLVSHIFWANHEPVAWKFLEKAFAFRLASPLLLLALLSTRVIPKRKCQPAAYRLYLELVNRHAFSLSSEVRGPNYDKTMRSIDEALNLSRIFGLQAAETGFLLAGFIFATVWLLLSASLDDEGLLELSDENKSVWVMTPDMNVQHPGRLDDQKIQSCFGLQQANTTFAIELVIGFLQNNVTSKILYLTQQSMPLHWGGFIQQLRVLTEKSVTMKNLKCVTREMLPWLISDLSRLFSKQCKMISNNDSCHSIGSLMASSGQCYGPSFSGLWLPIDLFLEDVVNGSQAFSTSVLSSLTGLVKTLKALYHTTWCSTFLGLWIAALRLVQRGELASSGPRTCPGTYLCVLLSIIPLVVADIAEEESEITNEVEYKLTSRNIEELALEKCQHELVSSLQMLGEYEHLLTPPLSMQSMADEAAARAIMFNSGSTFCTGNDEYTSTDGMRTHFSGNMRHLIVEACISRNILDRSAYMWPGYVNIHAKIPHAPPTEAGGWSSLMNGSPLTPALVDALVSTPASSLEEIERIYKIAISGSDYEKISAAKVLCGTSLFRSWSVQEHILLFIVELLSTPGTTFQLIDYAQFLNVLLVGILSMECVQTFSLHGLVPLLAGALLPICEVFGSSVPSLSLTVPSGIDVSCYQVFSNAFTLLLHLLKLNHPPFHHLLGVEPSVDYQHSVEYMLLDRNHYLSDHAKIRKDHTRRARLLKLVSFCRKPIFMESIPKVNQWYTMYKACISSPLSGIAQEKSVYGIVDQLLYMMFRRINKDSHSSTSATSGSTDSLASAGEDISERLKVPAWDLLDATPLVLDAALTASANGRLFPRDLITGLKNLADFLPATLVTIVSYFSAEVSRSTWKPVHMNGADWPSPSAYLGKVKDEIKTTLTSCGVDVKSLNDEESSPAMLPLPLAALVSFTITYKMDKDRKVILGLISPALTNLSSSCRWPTMPIVASLWAQKAKQCSKLIILSAAGTVFYHSNDAVTQLLRSCFTSALGLVSSNNFSNGGVNAFLSQGCGSEFAPGFLYSQVHHSFRDLLFVTEVVLSLLMSSVKDIANCASAQEKPGGVLKKTKYGTRFGQASLASAMNRIKLAASIGASLVWMTGGPNLVRTFVRKTLPSWFISVSGSGRQQDGRLVNILGGYALSYLVVFSATFAWGLDSTSPAGKRRSAVIEEHLGFIASAMEGKIPVGCSHCTWRTYVTRYVRLMVQYLPKWVVDVDAGTLKRVSRGLSQWNEDELALALLVHGGVGNAGAAAQLILELERK